MQAAAQQSSQGTVWKGCCVEQAFLLLFKLHCKLQKQFALHMQLQRGRPCVISAVSSLCGPLS